VWRLRLTIQPLSNRAESHCQGHNRGKNRETIEQMPTKPLSTLKHAHLSLYPGFGQDRFGQLRVKAAFGPASSGTPWP